MDDAERQSWLLAAIVITIQVHCRDRPQVSLDRNGRAAKRERAKFTGVAIAVGTTADETLGTSSANGLVAVDLDRIEVSTHRDLVVRALTRSDNGNRPR